MSTRSRLVRGSKHVLQARLYKTHFIPYITIKPRKQPINEYKMNISGKYGERFKRYPEYGGIYAK